MNNGLNKKNAGRPHSYTCNPKQKSPSEKYLDKCHIRGSNTSFLCYISTECITLVRFYTLSTRCATFVARENYEREIARRRKCVGSLKINL